MRLPTQLILAAITMLCSCAHHGEPRFTRGAGDAGQFILRHALACGGQPITTNGLPAITAGWSYSEDQYGAIIRLSSRDYDAVEILLRQAFGAPKFGPVGTSDGGKLGGYRLTPKGGTIQFGCDAEGTHVTVVRSLSQEEFSGALRRATQDEKFRKRMGEDLSRRPDESVK